VNKDVITLNPFGPPATIIKWKISEKRDFIVHFVFSNLGALYHELDSALFGCLRTLHFWHLYK
jgi:hypothetical protein